MTTKYTYQLTSFPNQKFNFDRLQYEIEHSLINTSLDYAAGLNGDGGTGVAINFKTSLSDAEKATLDAIVAAHTGEPLAPVPVKTEIAQACEQFNSLAISLCGTPLNRNLSNSRSLSGNFFNIF